MKAKRITIKHVRKLLENINAYVHIGNFKTGNRTNLNRVNSICYSAYYEYNEFTNNETKLAVIAEINIYRVFEAERTEMCYYLKNNYTEYHIYFDNKSKFYYTEIDGNQFLTVTYMGVCNVYQLFTESLPKSENTESEIKEQLENVYNELQTGKQIYIKTNVGILSVICMIPGNFALTVRGHKTHTLPNKFDIFYNYIKKYML